MTTRPITRKSQSRAHRIARESRRRKRWTVRASLAFRHLLAAGASAGLSLSGPVAAMLVPVVGVYALGHTVQAQTLYIDGAAGSDSNPGTSPAAPRKTLPTSHTPGAVYNVSGPIRGATVPSWALTGGASVNVIDAAGVTIRAWEGMDPPDIRGDHLLSAEGWSASDDGFVKTIDTGLTIAAMALNWDTSIEGSDHHFGHLIPSDLGDVTSPPDSLGRYHYDSDTGALTVYLAGLDPSEEAVKVHLCVIPAEAHALEFTAADGVVEGCIFSLWPTQSSGGQNGWAVIFAQGATGGRAEGCTARDMGAHGFGSHTADDTTLIDCVCHATRGSAGHFINYGATLPSCTQTRSGCSAHVYRYLGTDSNTRLDGTAPQDALGGVPYYTHADGGSTAMATPHEGCEVILFEDPGVNAQDFPFTANHTAAPSDRGVWADYPHRLDNCRIEGYGATTLGHDIAMRRCSIVQTRDLDGSNFGSAKMGVLSYNGDFTGLTRSCLLEACDVVCNLDTDAGGGSVGRCFLVRTSAGTCFFRLVNVSAFNAGTETPSNFKAFFEYAGGDAQSFRCYGSVFSHLTAGSAAALCIGDGGVAAGNHLFVDCAYHNINSAGGRYSQNSAIDTSAEWIAGVDTAGVVLSAQSFEDYGDGELNPAPGSEVMTGFRTTSAVVPSAGINGAYAGQRGAWQFARPALVSAAVHDAGAGEVDFTFSEEPETLDTENAFHFSGLSAFAGLSAISPTLWRGTFDPITPGVPASVTIDANGIIALATGIGNAEIAGFPVSNPGAGTGAAALVRGGGGAGERFGRLGRA